MKKKKTPTLRSLKDRAWKLFSEWIRRKDADEGGTVQCVTCKGLFHWKETHAGHFVPGRTNSVLLVEELVHVQCPICNIWRGGNYHAYTLFMLDTYGRAKVDEFLALRHQVKKMTRADWEAKIEEYKQKLEELENEYKAQLA